MLWGGLGLLAIFVPLYLFGLPRRGEVRPFLRGGELRASFYSVVLVALLMTGVALTIAGLR